MTPPEGATNLLCNKILPDDKAFWLKKNDSTPVAKANSIKDMIEALRKSHPQVVQYHLRFGLNDFAKWAKECFGAEVLARELEAIKLDPDPRITQSKLLAAFERALVAKPAFGPLAKTAVPSMPPVALAKTATQTTLNKKKTR